jgi:nicotinate-nucleotide--dimethylbenzimidazole phosphoribosyltransferase
MLAHTIAAIRPLEMAAMAQARDLQTRLTKPPGSLGALEELSVRLAGLAGVCPPPLPAPAAVAIFAGDHGVVAQGISAWPSAVTGQMVANFAAGTAVVNTFARQMGAAVTVVDVGMATYVDATDQHEAPPADKVALLARKVRAGTRDLSVEPALTHDEVLAAIQVGIDVAHSLVDGGARVLITGDMGIGNTTPAATLIATFTGASASEVTGHGAGVDDAMYRHKVAVVEAALARHAPDPADPVAALAAVGGLEHAALVGFLLGAAARRTPVLLDGVVAVSAALVAVALAPDVLGALIAGHRSAEPGATVGLARLGLAPLLDLGLRLGEGTGALLAWPIVVAAVRVLHEVATFESAGVVRG